MIFGIFADPGIAVVNVRGVNILIGDGRKDDEPLLEEFSAESIVGTGVREIDDQFERFAAEGLQREDDVVNEQVSVGFADLVSTGDVVEDGIARLGCARLVEDVERFDRFEFVFFVHVVLRHDLFELGRSHVHAAPSKQVKVQVKLS